MLLADFMLTCLFNTTAFALANRLWSMVTASPIPFRSQFRCRYTLPMPACFLYGDKDEYLESFNAHALFQPATVISYGGGAQLSQGTASRSLPRTDRVC